jgi:hypothetical protein
MFCYHGRLVVYSRNLALILVVWHAWSLVPLVPLQGQVRLTLFFILNGAGTVADFTIWGPAHENDTIVRRICSWLLCIFLAQWTVAKCNIPDGMRAIDWTNLCGTRITDIM